VICEDARILGIPEDEHKLGASIPVLARLVFKAMLQVERGMVDVVSKGKEENSPRKITTLEDWAALPLIQTSPVLNVPGE
jgi:hypothetical protein